MSYSQSASEYAESNIYYIDLPLPSNTINSTNLNKNMSLPNGGGSSNSGTTTY